MLGQSPPSFEIVYPDKIEFTPPRRWNYVVVNKHDRNVGLGQNGDYLPVYPCRIAQKLDRLEYNAGNAFAHKVRRKILCLLRTNLV